ncbi:nitroreductase family protein [Methanobrevibacter olleyae]|uniref:Nitroreductase n=1 Tax=Methanobrevibacter olleyae TaxID=294671 RepID=A0A126QX39_METOL|nr:nitroreductase family protein [Methanobrevibacter olleyae]AMK14700.1 nitroreductase family protein [Methanobrevibacter olleyae]SFL41772.1 Nitroreductase [Methanobrevibacter olleyae]
MADIFEVIKNRRSVREYKQEQIDDEDIEKILHAAILAPTARGEAPWHFTVIQNKELLDDINESVNNILRNSGDELLEAIAKSGKHIMHNAPTVVIVSAKSSATNMQADVSAAIENMLLAAEGLDIGSCWLGLIAAYFSIEENLKNLHIPEGYTPLYGVSLGYKVNENEPNPRDDVLINWLK